MVPPREEIKLSGRSTVVVKQVICKYESELVRYLKHNDHIPHAMRKIKELCSKLVECYQQIYSLL